jgi:hypothetical protein
LASYDDQYEHVAPGPQEYLLSPIVPLEREKGLEDTSATPRDSDSDDKDTYEDLQEFEPPPPVAPTVTPPPAPPTRPQRSTANKPPTRYEDELADQKAKKRAAKLQKRGINPGSTARTAFSRTCVTRTYERHTTSFNAYGVKIDPNPRIPRSYKAAINGPDRPEWVIFTKDEFYLLKDNHTWRIVRRPLRVYVLTGK